jgi:hypothetical protein
MSKKREETTETKDFFKSMATMTLPIIALVDRTASVNQSLSKETTTNRADCTDCGAQCLSGCKDECITVSD